ncbi:hypothetical protein GCM10020220_035600 [Nonomuraea rubra]
MCSTLSWDETASGPWDIFGWGWAGADANMTRLAELLPALHKLATTASSQRHGSMACLTVCNAQQRHGLHRGGEANGFPAFMRG